MLTIHQEPEIQEINNDFLDQKKIQLFVKREDLIHPDVSGNKWRKLKYNLIQAKSEGHHTLLTFGGAYSNHIYATAAAAKEVGFKSIGIIRGEEHLPLNHTLSFAKEQGMHISYMDRSTYRLKKTAPIIQQLRDKYGDFYLVPEGGTNNLAIKGCEEIVDDEVRSFDYVCSASGTGGTLSGIIVGMQGAGQVLGFSALKGDFLQKEVGDLLKGYGVDYQNWKVNTDYHFGGYAKINAELMSFIHRFREEHNLPLDPVYTGKMMFGLWALIGMDYFEPGSKILAIHTGGLQGLKGFE
ncbi:1-aminocyclopropane-1-carboxylate deaminase/D-cysteine desulfhydrase [Fulvivirga sediminis]|uniref:1-aminocyclopropane-1-carboxylate deaminase/D-cysteine desulfhydrase n=1 Tax=Fulvivirga sediminis TaxID=2803949 RepID=A0A937F2Z4_9BACT|nr:pyridoxal-phosphate dependent enzyme [Fulvivirga sediminis]MBL3654770.1 1-aminocyclopropane-1-carboxylate deaminase/D-cysteine desulfhydrase [Fulvivirga sediminis]